ncbi:MAG: hypothetical protein H0U10_10045 [Chloroflexia bacterium]|nr:hypothetical protein [Chloroflexia bacterium]
MTDVPGLIDQAPLQDRDLLQRLSLYFDAVDIRLRQGEGWFIFNALPGRSRRISSFIQARLSDHQPAVSSFFMPWRDFALSAYVTEVGLPELAPAVGVDHRVKQEFDLAMRVTVDTWTQVVSTDLLVLAGLQPANRHEAALLDRTIEQRHSHKLATILLTPTMPQQLEAEFSTVDSGEGYWGRIFGRMYETSLVAL